MLACKQGVQAIGYSVAQLPMAQSEVQRKPEEDQWYISAATIADQSLIRDYLNQLEPESRRLRFQANVVQVSDSIMQLYDGNRSCQCATLVVKDPSCRHKVFGEAIMVQSDHARDAEIGLSVTDDLRGRGLGVALLRSLITRAKQAGFSRIHADTLRENNAFIMLAQSLGFTKSRHPEDWIQVRLTLTL